MSSLLGFVLAREHERSVPCDTDLSATNQEAPFRLRTWSYGPEKNKTMYYPLNDHAIFVLCSKEFTGFKSFKIFFKNYFKVTKEFFSGA